VRPNPGFEAQLRLYAEMGWQIDPKNKEYKYFRLSIASDRMRKGKERYSKTFYMINNDFFAAKILPHDCLDVVRPDPFLATLNPEPLVYRCRHCRYIHGIIFLSASEIVIFCRRIIASASNVFPHHIATDSVGWQVKRVNSVRRKSMGSLQPVPSAEEVEVGKTCQATLFVEPLAWMQPQISHEPQGKLLCPKCKGKLGAYSWVSGKFD